MKQNKHPHPQISALRTRCAFSTRNLDAGEDNVDDIALRRSFDQLLNPGTVSNEASHHTVMHNLIPVFACHYSEQHGNSFAG